MKNKEIGKNKIKDRAIHYFNEISLSMGKGESPPQRLSFFSHRVYTLLCVCVCVFAFLHHPRKQLVNHKSHLRHRQR